MFHSYFERKIQGEFEKFKKNDKVLLFNNAHFPNFEISASL